MSWFSRKARNRKLGREYVLDVKLRSSKVRATRARMAGVALGVVFAAVLGVFLIWRAGEYALTELVYENKAFALQDIDIQTDGVIAVDQLKRWAGVRSGQNLLALDLARVKRDLEMVPVVQSASVERVLPHTLRVRVVERMPLAQVNIPRLLPNGGIEIAVFHLDPEGCVMLPLEAQQRVKPAADHVEQMPVISGLTGNDIQAGRKVESWQVQAALQLVEAFAQSPMAGLADLKRIDVSCGDVLVVTSSQESEVTFGLADVEPQLKRWQLEQLRRWQLEQRLPPWQLERQKLRWHLENQLCRWHAIFVWGQKIGKAIASLDLAVPSHIPVQWLDASAVPAPAPKTPKANRTTKRNHV
jgi:cell division septal protein FtsQ